MTDYDCEAIEGFEILQQYLDNAGLLKSEKKWKYENDTDIFRYMSKEHFLDMVENKRIALSHISIWEDPFEGFIFKSSSRSEYLQKLYAGFYGQSWTYGKHESDLRWRAYCPDKNGIRIRTTVGKLKRLMNEIFQPHECAVRLLVGPVTYISDKDLGMKRSRSQGLAHALIPKSRKEAIKLLFLKREFFKREKEFRVICHVGHAGLQKLPLSENDAFERKDGLLKCHIPTSINALIDEVKVDPRMSIAEVDRLNCRLVQSDCGLTAKQSDIYHWPDFKFQ